MSYLRNLAEERIREAMERGEFDNLALKGQPLRPDDLQDVPEELRLGFRILKNAGVLPPEMELRKEMVRLQDLINCCLDDEERQRLRRTYQERLLHYRMLMEKGRA